MKLFERQGCAGIHSCLYAHTDKEDETQVLGTQAALVLQVGACFAHLSRCFWPHCCWVQLPLSRATIPGTRPLTATEKEQLLVGLRHLIESAQKPCTGSSVKALICTERQRVSERPSTVSA